MPMGAALTGTYSFKGVLASQWYLDCMANNGTPLSNLKNQDVSRGNLAFNFFKAMSTKEEVVIFLARPRDEAAATRAVKVVETWVRKAAWSKCQLGSATACPFASSGRATRGARGAPHSQGGPGQ